MFPFVAAAFAPLCCALGQLPSDQESDEPKSEGKPTADTLPAAEDERDPGSDIHLLRTQWFDKVSKTLPHPEYPRMLMRRPRWLNLNGPWQWCEIERLEGCPDVPESAEAILVPFPIESQLSGVGRHVGRLACRRTFAVPADWNARRLILHFGAVSWGCRVWVNGRLVGSHEGSYSPFSLDITDEINPNRDVQELTVAIENPVDAGPQPRGKQVLEPKSIFYTPCTGIWQTVWLEPVSESSVRRLTLTPNLDHELLQIDLEGALDGCTATATAFVGDQPAGRATFDAASRGELTIVQPRLWSPDDPFLYRLEVTISRDGQIVDAFTSEFGMRSIAVGPDDNGVPRLLLNGQPLFQFGPLDQGYWPEGNYTAPTDEALRFDIEEIKALGMNMIRKHAKTEPDRWYWWADRLGVLVWQDMPQGYDQNPPEAVRDQFKVELTEMVQSLRSHASIVVWSPFNEGWGQHDTEAITSYLERLDPSRLVNSASGWTDKGCGSFFDIHHYPEPECPEPHGSRALVLGEYGGLGFPCEGHLWSKGWSYMQPESLESLTKTYVDYLDQIRSFALKSGLSAAVYTQTTDVEQEINGLWTYDRKVFKLDRDQVKAASTLTSNVLDGLRAAAGS